MPATLEHLLRRTAGKEIDIPWDRIRMYKDQPREYFDKRELGRLAGSVEAVGQVVAVLVRRIKDDPKHDYQLLDGQRRHIACGMIEKKTIRAVVIEGELTPEEQFIVSVIANFSRAGHTPMELARALSRMRKFGFTAEQIAKFCGQSKPWVTAHLSILNIAPELEAMTEPKPGESKAELQYSTAVHLVKGPKPLQVELAQEIVAKEMPLNVARAFIRNEFARHGVGCGGRRRVPADDYRNFQSLLSRILKYGEMFQDMNPDTFKAMFASRSPEEVLAVRRDIEKCRKMLEKLAAQMP